MWMDLGSMRLSKIIQRTANAVCYLLWVESKKTLQTIEYSKKETDSWTQRIN